MSIALPMQLNYSENSHKNCTGLFLSSCEPKFIIETVIQCGMSQNDLEILFLPSSKLDKQPEHCFLIGQPTKKIHSDSIIPYCLLHNCLFVPQHATLHPHVSQNEIENMVHSRTAILHPKIGLYHLDPEQTYKLEDLLDLPKIDFNNVTSGRCHPVIAPLANILVDTTSDIEEMFAKEQENIGDRPMSSLDKMVEGQELKNREKPLMWVQGLTARAALGFTRLMPSGASKETWVDRIADWAQNKLSHMNERLDATRNKELTRLLDLLEKNPDEGLHYALPLGGEPGRGRSNNPGGHLTSHETRFSLGGIGGGGISDYWDVQDAMRQKLTASYSTLAEKEIHLGNHKKAAYIYSHLLGNHRAAATALEQGGFFQEASVLYEKHLHDPLKAAQCLMHGGLAQQAAEKYESLKMYAEAAECMEKVENAPEAIRLWELQIKKYILEKDILSAAKLMRQKCSNFDEALYLLIKAWPQHPQSKSCLLEAIDMLHQANRSSDAETHLRLLTNAELDPPQLKNLFLVAHAIHYKNYSNTLNDQLHNNCRIQLAQHLEKSYTRYRHIIPLLATLKEEDRLLKRDCQRLFNKKEQAIERKYTIVDEVIEIEPTDSIRLPFADYWHAWCSGQSMILWSNVSTQYRLTRLNHQQQTENLTWEIEQDTTDSLVNIPNGISDQNSFYAHIGQSQLDNKTFAANDTGPAMQVKGYPNSHLCEHQYASCYGEYGVLFIFYVNHEQEICLEQWSETGELRIQYDVSVFYTEEFRHEITGDTDFFLNILKNQPILHFNQNTVHWSKTDIPPQLSKSHTTFLNVCQPNKWSRARLLAGTENGFAVLTIEDGSLVSRQHSTHSASIATGFIGNAMAIINNNGGEIYLYTQNRFHLKARLSNLHHTPIISIQRGKDNKQLCVFYADGYIQFYHIPLLT